MMTTNISLVILSSLLLILLVWCAVISVWIARTRQSFKKLGENLDKKDALSVLKKLYVDQTALAENQKSFEQLLKKIQLNSRQHFQKMGFVRFNPFDNAGGDQSFCLCLLTEDNDGIVITSLHGRESTRLYAKAVDEKFLADQSGSVEERKAYQLASKSARIQTVVV